MILGLGPGSWELGMGTLGMCTARSERAKSRLQNGPPDNQRAPAALVTADLQPVRPDPKPCMDLFQRPKGENLSPAGNGGQGDGSHRWETTWGFIGEVYSLGPNPC